MQWSYHLCSTITATTSKFKMAVEIGVLRLTREALYFCSTITATISNFCGSSKLTCQLFTRFMAIYMDFFRKWQNKFNINLIYSVKEILGSSQYLPAGGILFHVRKFYPLNFSKKSFNPLNLPEIGEKVLPP